MQLIKRKKRILLGVAIILLASSFTLTNNVFSKGITPVFTRVVLERDQMVNRYVAIENDKDYEIFVTPKVYKYYPQSEYITDLEEFEEFIIIDTDYFKIPPNSLENINFQIRGNEALDLGTYYNLIVFQESHEIVQEGDIIGTTGNLAHVVQVDLVADSNLERFTEDYSLKFRVVDRGIPFIKPVELELSFFNNSSYTLIPKGEIRVEKRSMNSEPEYIKVNTQRKRVYPNDSLDMTFYVRNWYLEDIIFNKKASLQIQNGIDNGVIVKEIEITGFRNELLYLLTGITLIILLLRFINEDIKAKKQSS